MMSLIIYFEGCIPADSWSLRCYSGSPDYEHRQEGSKFDGSQM